MAVGPLSSRVQVQPTATRGGACPVPAPKPQVKQCDVPTARPSSVLTRLKQDGFDETPKPQVRANQERSSSSFAAALPEIITITQKLGVEKSQKFMEFMGAVTGGPPAQTEKLLKNLNSSTEGMATLSSLATSYKEAAKGNYLASAAYLAEAAGSGWNVLPEATRNRMATKVASSVAGTKIGPFVGVLAETGAGDGMKAVGGLLRGNASDFFGAMKDVAKSLYDNPTLAKKLTPRLVKTATDVLPEGDRHLWSKMLGKKVPVVGTAIVGVMDLAAIAADPKDAKNWAGLGSTIAGAFAGPGTAISVTIDIGILGAEVFDAVAALRGNMKATNPATN